MDRDDPILDGAILALACVNSEDPGRLAVNYIYNYLNWSELDKIPVDVRRYCLLRNHGIKDYEALSVKEKNQGIARFGCAALAFFFSNIRSGKCPKCKKVSAEKTIEGYMVGPCLGCGWDYDQGI